MRDWKTASSFLFGTTDMYQAFGIQITEDGMPQELLIPGLRQRKVKIPLRSGSYDYGAKYYDDRPIPVTCVTTRVVTREESREIAYVLSKKTQIRFWTEPDKYYVGRVYTAPSLEQMRKVGFRFTLNFDLEPFAYRNTITTPFSDRQLIPSYQGTAPTPTYIVIENTGTGIAKNIQIVQTIKREN